MFREIPRGLLARLPIVPVTASFVYAKVMFVGKFQLVLRVIGPRRRCRRRRCRRRRLRETRAPPCAHQQLPKQGCKETSRRAASTEVTKSWLNELQRSANYCPS